MRAGFAVGVDVGTSASKAVVLDPERGVRGTGSAPHPVTVPGPGLAEQDPADWYGSACAAVRAAIANAGVDGGDVTAIAVSGQGAALVALDGSGEPLHPALIHLDQRAAQEATALRAGEVGHRVRASRGGAVSAWNAAAKLAWLRRHEPAVAGAAEVFTSAAGYLLRRLTGEAWQSHSDAGVSDLYDLARRAWSAPVADALAVGVDRLPRLAAGTEVVGTLRPAAAANLSLSTACPVVAGGEDTASAALAAGVTGPASGFLSLGSAGVLGAAVPSGPPGPARVLRFPHVLDRLDLLSGSTATVGAALRWLGELLGRTPAALLALAETVPPGADGVEFLPYLAGELHPVDDPHARAAFTGLSLATTAGSLARAVVEGTSAAIAHNLAAAREAGAAPHRLAATGGPTRSELWCQALADATGLPVTVCEHDSAPLGDALLAASETSAEACELAERRLRILRVHEPEPAEHARARERLDRLQRVYRATRHPHSTLH
jgi:xylulokinase